jgi:uncharacterized protein with HEPN domain
MSLRHMRDHAREACLMVAGKSREDLGTDRMMQLAVTRLVEIVGEAANRVSSAGQQQLTDIPWSQIVGLRNRLVHGYDAIDLDILWEILQQDLPTLIRALDSAGYGRDQG